MSDDEDEQWAAINTYANYRPAKREITPNNLCVVPAIIM